MNILSKDEIINQLLSKIKIGSGWSVNDNAIVGWKNKMCCGTPRGVYLQCEDTGFVLFINNPVSRSMILNYEYALNIYKEYLNKIITN